MILRRITKHVKDQNWFAVGLDFFIVIAGILIAFQITNWSEARQQKRVYDAAFERVIDEMHTNLESQKFIGDGVREELPIIQRAIADLRACRTDVNARKNIEAALIPLANPYIQILQTDALEQFLNNDGFLRFQKPSDRDLLGETLRRLRLYMIDGEREAGIMRSELRAMRHILRPGQLNYASPDGFLEEFLGKYSLSPPPFRESIIAVPLSEACKDQRFLDGFVLWEEQAFKLAVLAGGVDKRIRDNLEVLERPVDVDVEENR